MNAFIMMHERLLFRSSPDKGRAGGVCSAKIGFLHDLPPQTPLNPPLSGGKWANKGSSKNKPYFLTVCLGFETRQSLASNRVNPTQNPSASAVTLPLLQKRARFACPFLLINPPKSRGVLFDAY
jgi:hypothetical protein